MYLAGSLLSRVTPVRSFKIVQYGKRATARCALDASWDAYPYAVPLPVPQRSMENHESYNFYYSTFCVISTVRRTSGGQKTTSSHPAGPRIRSHAVRSQWSHVVVDVMITHLLV